MSAAGAKLKLQSSDKYMFEVEEGVAFLSQTIKNSVEDAEADLVPLPNVSGKILAKVLEYCRYHFDAVQEGPTFKSEEEQKAWDDEFLKVYQAVLFDLILAANYLNITGLLDLTCKAVAGMIKGKTPEEIRTTFNIKNDLTPEEEQRLYDEIEWKFE